MDIREAQNLIRETYYHRDSARGLDRTFLWFVEEVGELSEAVRRRDASSAGEEVADVLAWLLSVANILEVDVEEAFLRQYGSGCPRCGRRPCVCPEE